MEVSRKSQEPINPFSGANDKGIELVKKLHENDLASLFSLALAGALKLHDTRMQKFDYYFFVDLSGEQAKSYIHASVPSKVANFVASLVQPVYRVIKGIKRNELNDYDDIFKRVRRDFPINSQDSERNEQIKKIWERAIFGLEFLSQTYHGDTECFNFLKNKSKEIRTYLDGKVDTDQEGDPPPVAAIVQNVWTTASIQKINTMLDQIESGKHDQIDGFYGELAKRQLEMMEKVNIMLEVLSKGGKIPSKRPESSAVATQTSAELVEPDEPIKGAAGSGEGAETSEVVDNTSERQPEASGQELQPEAN